MSAVRKTKMVAEKALHVSQELGTGPGKPFGVGQRERLGQRQGRDDELRGRKLKASNDVAKIRQAKGLEAV